MLVRLKICKKYLSDDENQNNIASRFINNLELNIICIPLTLPIAFLWVFNILFLSQYVFEALNTNFNWIHYVILFAIVNIYIIELVYIFKKFDKVISFFKLPLEENGKLSKIINNYDDTTETKITLKAIFVVQLFLFYCALISILFI